MKEIQAIDYAIRSIVRQINEKGVPISALSRLSGVSRQTIYRLMHYDGANPLKIPELKRIAYAMCEWNEANKKARWGRKTNG